MIGGRSLAQDLVRDIRRPLSKIHSWQQCYDYFGRDDRRFAIDEGALRLAFYLASWGMYRGSADIRNYSYQALIPVVSTLRRPDARALRDVTLEDALKRVDELFDLLRSIDDDLQRTMSRISVTDTLKTKIALGTVACIPAYDRFVAIAARRLGWPASLTGRSYSKLLSGAIEHKQFHAFCETVTDEGIALPEMRLLDAFLNYLGWRLANNALG